MANRSVMLARALSVTLVLSMAGGTAFAHHSFAMFDMQKTISVTGTIKDFQWTNPHVWIDLDMVDTSTGLPSSYSVECGSPGILEHMGLTRESLKPGEKITVEVNPLKHGVGGSLVSVSINGKLVTHQAKF